MSAAKGFSGGFFGCFGVLAAVIVVVAAFLALGRGSDHEKVSEAVRQDDNTLANAEHCVNGLEQAEQRGLIEEGDSALEFPWSIRRSGARISCSIRKQGTLSYIVVEARCEDAKNAACTELVMPKEAQSSQTPS